MQLGFRHYILPSAQLLGVNHVNLRFQTDQLNVHDADPMHELCILYLALSA